MADENGFDFSVFLKNGGELTPVEEISAPTITQFHPDGSQEVVEDFAAVDFPRWRALLDAIEENQLSRLSQLLKDGYPIRSDHLIKICHERKWEALKVILDNNAWEINANLDEVRYCRPPLLAYVLLDEDVTLMLLDCGADPNTGLRGWTVLSEAVSWAPLKIIKLLFDRGGDSAKGHLLHRAVHRQGRGAQDKLDVMRYLIEMGAPIEDIDFKDGWRADLVIVNLYGNGTPLQKAVQLKDHDAVRLLLDNGADPNAKDLHGKRTALSIAEENEDWLAVDLLKASKTTPRQGGSKV